MLKLYTGNAVKPEGWLRRQLEIQANSLSGNLDKMWPDIQDSAWIGGQHEGWERVPYWLDGFIPLAWLLEDEDMMGRAKFYMDAILSRQKPDGWICPGEDANRKTYDIWSMFLIGKVLAMYCDFTGDKAAEEGLYRTMKCLYEHLSQGILTLFDWGKFRWFECVIPLLYLYERRPEDWMKELTVILKQQGADYPSFTDTWVRPLNRWTFHTHIVNICMMFKYEAVYSLMMGEKITGEAEKLWKHLEKYNGTAVGTFTGDECLSGIGASHGTELCAVAELMYSCQVLYAITEDPVWMERMEKAAFNAMPATLSDDMWTHQYDQMVNQIACLRFQGRSFYRTNDVDANMFGLEPNYGCCTANFIQAWPKLAMNAFLQSRKGIVSPVMLPARLDTEIKGAKVSLATRTEYPFRFDCAYTVTVSKPVSFELKIRIPKWAKAVKLNGQEVKAGRYLVVNKQWEGTETLTVELADVPRLVARPKGMKVVEYGPLVYALPIDTEYKMEEYEKNGVVRKFPYCDYELWPRSEWRYGFADTGFVPVLHEGDDVPFSSKAPRIGLKAKVARVNWEYADGFEYIAAHLPESNRAIGEAEEVELIPYGCAKLRMTEMPMTRKK